MTPTETVILGAYFFILCILAVYGWHRYALVYLYMKHKDRKVAIPVAPDDWPVVTIQLPLYGAFLSHEIPGPCRRPALRRGAVLRPFRGG